MATVISSKKSSVGGPYCYYTLTMTYSSRTTTSVKVSWKLTAKLASSSSVMGYSLTAYVYAGSNYQKKTLKGNSTWTGTGAHSIEGSFTVSGLSASTSSISTALKVTSGAPENACQLNKTNGSKLTISTVPKYTVSFNANSSGVTGATGIPGAVSKYKGASVAIPSTKPTSTSHDFLRWNTAAAGTGTNYNPGATYSADANATLYAQWTIKTYSVTYNANGGTGAPAAQTKTYGTDLTLSSIAPTRADGVTEEGATIKYTFVGWGTSALATASVYDPGDIYSANAAITLYAVWAALSGYLIKFNSLGGTPVSYLEKNIGESITIPSTIPEKNGYTFKGWSTSIEATTVNYNPGDTYSTDENLNLYAVWEPWSHTLHFNSNGGFSAPSDILITTDSEITIPESQIYRPNFVFKGWNTQLDGFGEYYETGQLYEHRQNGGTITLYAIWDTKDILIYSNGCCKGLEFIEGIESGTNFVNGGKIQTVEFIEGKTLNIDNTAFYLTEILEQHNLYKLTDESELILTDESGNRLYYIQ